MAAGASRRLGRAKQLLTDDAGLSAVVRMVRAMRDAGCARVIVVLGAHAEPVAAALAAEAVHLVTNAEWTDGMGRSIAVGVEAVTRVAPEAHAVLLCPCDMPAVTADHLRALLTQCRGGVRVASEYGRDDGEAVRGIPAVLPRADWPWLQALTGDTGARHLLREAQTRLVPLPDGEWDLDTPSDLERWQRRRSVARVPHGLPPT